MEHNNSPLAPSLTIAQFNNIIAALDTEAKPTYFKPTNSNGPSIDPEAHITGGVADLLISAVDASHSPATYTPELVFEGKRDGGQSFSDIQDQLLGYFKNNYAKNPYTGSQPLIMFAMGARGKQVAFWKWTVKEAGSGTLYRLEFDNDGKFKQEQPTTPWATPTLLSIEHPAQQTIVRIFIKNMLKIEG
ncbi:hypothetical protein H0H81_001552 [Sphagnurus paluster]|uniref:Uncharacterized protein n=1 Tax=Sphagnurus paluster TaxID=117069 RepID=A0A9P7FSY0_9AGAR|nr:hypothetical protein H0H81_001552 [Sphagnurus paluster]